MSCVILTPVDPWRIGGAAALQVYAPTASAALTGLIALWPTTLDEVTLSSIRTVTAEGLGLAPLRRPPTGPRRGIDSPRLEVMAFAEQFAVDVSRLSAEQRRAWIGSFGESVYDATLATYVADFVPRLRAALDALFGADEWYDVGLTPSPHSRLLMDEFIREVALLDALDPLTTELVRLRGARAHHCRLCMSRRSVAAMEAGASARTFQELDHYRDSSLTPRAQAALGWVDAMIWTPAHVRPDDVDAVRAHLAPREAVELALDITRNATNKIAVALGADEPWTDGVQLFVVDERGELAFP